MDAVPNLKSVISGLNVQYSSTSRHLWKPFHFRWKMEKRAYWKRDGYRCHPYWCYGTAQAVVESILDLLVLGCIQNRNWHVCVFFGGEEMGCLSVLTDPEWLEYVKCHSACWSTCSFTSGLLFFLVLNAGKNSGLCAMKFWKFQTLNFISFSQTQLSDFKNNYDFHIWLYSEVAKYFAFIIKQYDGSISTNERQGECYISLVHLAAGLKESFLGLWTTVTIVSLLMWVATDGPSQLSTENKANWSKVLRDDLSGECSKSDLLSFLN